jgi:hypothetical protein
MVTINFRGLLRPRQLLVERQPIDPARPNTLVYRITIPGLRDFKGSLLKQPPTGTTDNRPAVWVPCIGYSDMAELMVEADVRDGSLHDPRIRRITLIAPASMDAAGKDHVMLEIHDPEYPGRVISKGRIILEFGADGRIGEQHAEGYTMIRGLDPTATLDLGETIPEITPEDCWATAVGNPGVAPAPVPAPVPTPAPAPPAG